ncbi:MAG: hydroxymethylglutaryl-CoA lyase [Armatimonadetes bacterium]|nr:hydroxymethylglutaryl-CoA lyase [Armatimonadota bacterium]
MPSAVRLIEVGPRDGLQNEKTPISTESKLSFINCLLDSGLREIEITSFVSPKWVPQLGDAMDLIAALPMDRGALYSALVPNQKGLERALETGIDRIALFTAASESFTKKNINATIAESLANFREIMTEFRKVHPKGFVRGYVSTVIECPYEGRVAPDQVKPVVMELAQMGVNEICLGETIGVAVPAEVEALAHVLEDSIDVEMIAWHFHDTRGTAIANVEAMWRRGYRSFDASAGGLGGCPYAPGAGGNLAMEDLVYFLERSGVQTGVDLSKLALASEPIWQELGRTSPSKVHQAVLSACQG